MSIVEVPLSQGKVAVIDAEDWPLIAPYKWHARKSHGRTWYASANGPGTKNRAHFSMHRLIMKAPSGTQVDHRDHDGLNNRKENLRLATHAQNAMNTPTKRTSRTGFKGVSWDEEKGRYLAQIMAHGRHFHLGRYDTALEAARAYDRKAREVHGDFAQLNFPD